MLAVVSVVDHAYVVAPPAVRVAEAPLHIVGEFTVVTGSGLTVTTAVPVLLHVFASVPVTVYVVVLVGLTVMAVVPAPVDQL